jgi:hypothetical protein
LLFAAVHEPAIGTKQPSWKWPMNVRLLGTAD